MLNKKDLKELKELYKATPSGGVFVFKNRKVTKEYAKDMIEFLEACFEFHNDFRLSRPSAKKGRNVSISNLVERKQELRISNGRLQKLSPRHRLHG